MEINITNILKKIIEKKDTKYFAKKRGDTAYQLNDGRIAIFKPGDIVIRIMDYSFSDINSRINFEKNNSIIFNLLQFVYDKPARGYLGVIIKSPEMYFFENGKPHAWRMSFEKDYFYINDLFNAFVIIIPEEDREEFFKDEKKIVYTATYDQEKNMMKVVITEQTHMYMDFYNKKNSFKALNGLQLSSHSYPAAYMSSMKVYVRGDHEHLNNSLIYFSLNHFELFREAVEEYNTIHK